MQFVTSQGTLNASIAKLYIAGWIGRDGDAVDHHIKELQAIGISPPSEVPLFYQVSNTHLTQANRISVLGAGSSGEVEPLVLHQEGKIWLGLGSDHTDRDLETYSVAYSKQACLKPVANELWEYSAVKTHLDEIILRSWIFEDENWRLYQEGALSSIRPLDQLMAAVEFEEDSAMLCGTLPAIGGVRASNKFRMEIFDPVLNRKIEAEYDVEELAIIA